MAQKIKRAVCFSKPLEIILLVLVFLTFNFLFLSSVEKKLAKNLAVGDESPSGKREKRHNLLIENTFQDEPQQLITFEEDGRFGNLLLETATLLLIGRKFNKQVNLLPQVAQKLKNYFSSLPAEPIDHTKHCVCHFCSECVCPVCTKWTKVPSWSYIQRPESFSNASNLMLKWFNSDLILRNLDEAKQFYQPLLRGDVINVIQDYLQVIRKERGGSVTFVNIHVRRTDYISFVENRYKGHEVGRSFFLHCIREFLSLHPDSVFLVTSDDLAWCRANIRHERVIFPRLLSPADPAVTDFLLMTQANHTIYDYGSFAFWGAALAGGRTMVADGYSPKLHPILAAIKKSPPPGWTLVDVTKLEKDVE